MRVVVLLLAIALVGAPACDNVLAPVEQTRDGLTDPKRGGVPVISGVVDPPVSDVQIQIIVPTDVDPNNPVVSIDEEFVAFMASVEGGAGVLTYVWDFGDGDIVPDGDTILHTYNVAGTYTVWVEVTDTYEGGSATATNTLTLTVIGGPSVLAVDIDIKPGSYPNSINLGSNGNVPVAILSTTTFDATTVDPATVTLADAAVRVVGKKGNLQADVEDVNMDGLMDLVVHIDTTGLNLTEGDVEAMLTGTTYDSTEIEGSDWVRIVP